MLQIGTTAVCEASQELGAVYDYLDSLSVNKTHEASEEDTVKIAKSYLNNHKTRIMIIASVSCFEKEIYEIVKSIYATNKNSTLKEFIEKMIEGKYFQIFDFKDENKRSISRFYNLFGEDFKKWCKKREKECDMLENIESFMLLNRLRNRLAHRGYDYNIGYSHESVYQHFEKACEMLNWLSDSLKKFEENENKDC